MQRGAGKRKGSSFERVICKSLSLWITKGKSADAFWRSSLSGGRATVAHRKGQSVRQAGDICAVAPEGHSLTDRFYFECKHYRDLKWDRFILEGAGPLAKFWKEARKQALVHGREPVLIAKQNGYPVFVIAMQDSLLAADVDWARLIIVRDECAVILLSTLLRVDYARIGNG
jgi:hypothetical protein